MQILRQYLIINDILRQFGGWPAKVSIARYPKAVVWNANDGVPRLRNVAPRLQRSTQRQHRCEHNEN
ncbi:MAG: hypothetical protein ISS76_03430 [Phycisphaerae bacterium]|nr:hypothetical protein [Phycisphaerae bacterium]